MFPLTRLRDHEFWALQLLLLEDWSETLFVTGGCTKLSSPKLREPWEKCLKGGVIAAKIVRRGCQAWDWSANVPKMWELTPIAQIYTSGIDSGTWPRYSHRRYRIWSPTPSRIADWPHTAPPAPSLRLTVWFASPVLIASPQVELPTNRYFH